MNYISDPSSLPPQFNSQSVCRSANRSINHIFLLSYTFCQSVSVCTSLSLFSLSTLIYIIVHYFYIHIHRWSSYRNQSFMLSHLYTNQEKITWTQNLCSEFANTVMNDIEEMTVRKLIFFLPKKNSKTVKFLFQR